MGPDQTGDEPSRRGKVVMLVCNGIKGDSRVQKAAYSAAEAGWDVVLLGRSPDRKIHKWSIGQARAMLVPVPTRLDRTRHPLRGFGIRYPFAYQLGRPEAAYRAQKVKAWRVDLSIRRASLTLAQQEGGFRALWARLRRIGLLAPRVAAKGMSRWVAFRHRQLIKRVSSRRRCDTRLDRLVTSACRKIRGRRSWRTLWPALWDFEIAYGPVVDKLKADLIHANDFRVIGVGARAKTRALAKGRPLKLVWDAHEFLPGIKPWVDNERWKPAHIDHEREYVPCADAAVTVSDSLAELLQRTHRLARKPTVVLNAPSMRPPQETSDEPLPSLREQCELDPDVPLVVYSGAASPQRGLATMVEALPRLPSVHAALVVPNPEAAAIRKLLARAAALGAGDRLHVLGYVEHWQVPHFLSSADVGAIPIHHWPNHELALITKFFEYSHARLPVVVSDVETMARTVRETGQGEVFRAEDIEDYARAVRAVLADSARYRAAYDKPGLLDAWTWEAQAEVLDQVYSELVPDRPRFPQRVRTNHTEMTAPPMSR
ncbi:glycosyltransferase family 4 protein [Streptomyces montanus]|nr:glycosyltransferase family 4 protein [Streptomyces montanus]